MEVHKILYNIHLKANVEFFFKIINPVVKIAKKKKHSEGVCLC